MALGYTGDENRALSSRDYGAMRQQEPHVNPKEDTWSRGSQVQAVRTKCHLSIKASLRASGGGWYTEAENHKGLWEDIRLRAVLGERVSRQPGADN